MDPGLGGARFGAHGKAGPASGPTVRGSIERGVDLAEVEGLILSSPNLEEWRREALLTSARSLAAFYESSGHASRSPSEPRL